MAATGIPASAAEERSRGFVRNSGQNTLRTLRRRANGGSVGGQPFGHSTDRRPSIRAVTEKISGFFGRKTTFWPSRPSFYLGHAPRRRFASCRTSSLSILYFSVLNGIDRKSVV